MKIATDGEMDSIYDDYELLQGGLWAIVNEAQIIVETLHIQSSDIDYYMVFVHQYTGEEAGVCCWSDAKAYFELAGKAGKKWQAECFKCEERHMFTTRQEMMECFTHRCTALHTRY